MKSVLRSLITLSWPLALAQMTNVLGGVLGSIILAKSSVYALAATLPATMLASTVTAFFSSFLGYSGTLVARHDGSGDASAGVSSFLHGLGMAILLLPAFVLLVPVGHQIFACFGHRHEMLSAERLFFTYLLFSGYLATLSGVLGGFLTGRGDSRFTGIALSAGNVLNVLLLPPLALGNHALSGIHGAGLANLLANGTATLVLSARIFGTLRNNQSTIVSMLFRPDRQRIIELLRLGIPNGLRQLVDCGGFFIFTALIARLDPIAVAASTAIFSVNNLHHAVREGIQRGVEILTGRSSKVVNRQLIREITFGGLLLMAACMATFAVILYTWKGTIFCWFLSSPEGAERAQFLRTTDLLLSVLWINLALEAVAMVLTAVCRGLGRTPQLFICQFVTSGLVWLPLVFLVHAFSPSVLGFWLTLSVCSAVLSILLAWQGLV